MKKLIYTSTAFILLLVLSSFKMSDNVSFSNTEISIENDTSIIQSFIFRVQKNIVDDAPNEKNYTVDLENVIESEGYLKPKSGFTNHHQHHEEEFLFVFLNSNHEEIYSVEAANPLIKHVEVAEEDGTLRRERVEVEEEVITMRVNKLEDLRDYEVYIVENGKRGKLIGSSYEMAIDPCEYENIGYIVAINAIEGINGEAIKCYINGEYIGEIPPGGETARFIRPAGKIYELKGITRNGTIEIMDINLERCEEVGVRFFMKK